MTALLPLFRDYLAITSTMTPLAAMISQPSQLAPASSPRLARQRCTPVSDSRQSAGGPGIARSQACRLLQSGARLRVIE